MSFIKLSFASFLLVAAIAVFTLAFGSEQAAKSNMQLCKHQYALCTSALCIPQPGDPTKAICFCDVEEGASMSSVPCNTNQPGTDANGTPWTWCLNKRCTVDPSDSKKAICVCDVLRTGEWITLGGKCDTATCTTGYWSGATVKDFNEASSFMVKSLNLDHSPVEWCPGAKP